MILRRDPNFRRIKAGGRGLFGTASYWLGPDHLLVVEVASYVERYRRFYYRDIQALVAGQTRARTVGNIVCGGITLFCLLGMLIIAADQGGRAWGSSAVVGAFVFGLVALLTLVGLFFNCLRGRTCALRVHTAAQAFVLPRISRWRSAQRLMDELTPLVLAAQTLGKPVSAVSPAPGLQSSENPSGSPGAELV